jgi:alpha-beta hydrolase superfamily lysophospholipase
VKPFEIRVAGAHKRPIHFGSASHPLFGFYHPPAEASWRGVGVVLCNPLGTDQTRSERTYRHLAERLSAAGFACLRFDLSGTGDSGGDEREPGLFRSWVEDIGRAVEELRACSGAEKIGLFGLRLGATLAMLHGAEHGDVDSLVLWGPCVSGPSFVREVTRLHKLYLRIEPQLANARPTPADGEEALGGFLPRRLIEDLSQVDLLKVERRPARRTLLIDGGSFPERDSLMARLRELEAAPQLETHLGHKFLITVSHRSLLPDEVIDSIVRWFTDAYPSLGVPPTREPPAPGLAPSGERPVVFGGSHPLFGILTPADPARARPGRPPIVLTNAGSVNRSGPHRTYVRMARRWAALGFDVFRMDLSGIGDSPVAPGAQENIPYPPTGLADIEEAIRAVGAERVIIVGLCSGGDYAFQLGLREGVVGAWLLNPRTFCVLDLVAVESADGAPPSASVDAVPRRLRAIAERGVDTLLVVSKNDPGVAYVDAHAGDAMRAVSAVPRFRRVDLDGTDHTFTPVEAQERLSDVLTDHLTSRY